MGTFEHTPSELAPGSIFTRPGHGTYWVSPQSDAIDNDHKSTSVETDQGIITLSNDEPIRVHPADTVPARATWGQQPGSGLRRTVVTVEVLHNEHDASPDPQAMTLGEIAQEGFDGSFSITTSSDTVEVSPAAMAALLVAQGSDPSFLLSNQQVFCRCGKDVTRVDGWFGVINHADPDSLDGIDHDTDADHVPVVDVPAGHDFCEDCMTAHPTGVPDPCSPDYNH